MPSQYRKPIQPRTQNTFSDDARPKRVTQMRRDNDAVAKPIIRPQHIDDAVRMLITDVIKPTVESNGTTVPVPVFYASAEHWSTQQRNGVIRDEKNKIMLPLIVFKRDSLEDREELERQNAMPEDPDLGITFAHRRYSRGNQYDQFSRLTNSQLKLEFYTVTTPDYVKATYTIVIWTEYTAQLNKIVEGFIHNSRSTKLPYPHRFVNVVDSYSFESVNNVGEDRVAKCTITLSMYGYLIPEYANDFDQNARKTLSTRRTLITGEALTSLDDIPRT